MDKFEVLTEVYGLKPQGKSAPMASSRTSQNHRIGSSFDYPNISSISTSLDPSFYKEIDDFNFVEKTEYNNKFEDDLFGLSSKLSKSREGIGGNSSFGYDFIFGGSDDSNFDSLFNNLHQERMFDSVAEGDLLGFATSQEKSGVNLRNLLDDFGHMDLGMGDLKKKNTAGESISDDLIPGFGGSFHHIHSDVDKRKEEKGSYVQKKNNQCDDENEMDLFFSGGKERIDAETKTKDFSFDTFFENKGGSTVTPTSSNGGVQVNNKAECAKSDTHDFSFVFNDLKACGDFNEIDGESEERRAARWKRHQEKIQRMAKAVSDMNQRDLEILHQQEERHKISEIVNIEMKQWVTGKEGNLRALLSTLHQVLWAECGWRPVPLTELITFTSVKRVYKKAALCVHPDKVQQKGASVRQKYMAEKIFDILKEAWNRFSTEELRSI